MAVVRRFNGCRFHLGPSRIVALRAQGRSGKHLQQQKDSYGGYRI